MVHHTEILRCLYNSSLHSVHTFCRECPWHKNTVQCGTDQKYNNGLSVCAGSRDTLLSPPRTRLGGHRKCLSADPKKTAALQQSVSDWKYSSEDYFRGVQERLGAFVKTGRLGPFANAYWGGHSAYKLPPEANLMATAHYLQALELQKEIIKIHAVLGSKNPHPQTFLVGGMSIPIDPNSQNAINADKIAMMLEYNKLAKEFVEKVYVPMYSLLLHSILTGQALVQGTETICLTVNSLRLRRAIRMICGFRQVSLKAVTFQT